MIDPDLIVIFGAFIFGIIVVVIVIYSDWFEGEH